MKSPFEKGLSCEETTWYVLRAKTAYTYNYFPATASLSALPGLKAGTLLAGISISSPV